MKTVTQQFTQKDTYAEGDSTSPVWIDETWENVTTGEFLGSSGVYETWASFAELDALKKDLSRQYGTYIGVITVDDGTAIGWDFEKETRYEDSREKYTQRTSIYIYRSKPQKITFTNCDYAIIPQGV